jgi:hypothetical protein
LVVFRVVLTIPVAIRLSIQVSRGLYRLLSRTTLFLVGVSPISATQKFLCGSVQV